VLRVCGGLYLLWLGIQALRHAGPAGVVASHAETRGPATLFFRGVLANAINPKVILFFLSFLPQFVVPAQGSASMQMALLGILFTAQAAVLFGLLGYFSGTVGQWLRGRPGVGTLLDRAAGVVFVALGVRLLVER
jgi:threonine/homoserine/homoserine lactone efflux protein